MTRAEASAARRRANYDARVARATSDRERWHALVWWWLSEIRRQPAGRRPVEVSRLELLAAEMNRSSAVTVREDQGAMPVEDANPLGGSAAPPALSAGARGQHTTAPTYVTHSNGRGEL